MTETPRVPASDLTPGQVRRAGAWAVGNREGDQAQITPDGVD